MASNCIFMSLLSSNSRLLFIQEGLLELSIWPLSGIYTNKAKQD